MARGSSGRATVSDGVFCELGPQLLQRRGRVDPATLAQNTMRQNTTPDCVALQRFELAEDEQVPLRASDGLEWQGSGRRDVA